MFFEENNRKAFKRSVSKDQVIHLNPLVTSQQKEYNNKGRLTGEPKL